MTLKDVVALAELLDVKISPNGSLGPIDTTFNILSEYEEDEILERHSLTWHYPQVTKKDADRIYASIIMVAKIRAGEVV